ncbi:MAG TPA: hypothetical protein VE398_22740 [Acidobacteriota bacterium]|nr:hypothetical protein [Acidobacteriota bacterium]
MKDMSIDGAIRKSLAGHKDNTTGHCPDENIIAAFLEMSLDVNERREVERHASQCASCQQIIGLALRLPEAENEPLPSQAAASSGRKTLFHFSLPVSMAAMILLAVLAGGLFYRVVRESLRLPTTPRTTELRPPGQAQGISAPKRPEAAIPDIKVAPKEQPVAVPAEKAKGSSPKPALRDTRHEQPAKDSAHTLSQRADDVAPQSLAKLEAAEEDKVGRQLPASPPAALPAPIQPLLETGAPLVTPPVQAENRSLSVKRAAISTLPENYKTIDGMAAVQAEMSMKKRAGALAGAGVGGTQPVALKPAAAPREAVVNLADLNRSEREKLVSKRAGGLTFYQFSGYWIDLQCIKEISRTYVDVKVGSVEYKQILESLPELEEMHPAIVHWNGRDLILR